MTYTLTTDYPFDAMGYLDAIAACGGTVTGQQEVDDGTAVHVIRFTASDAAVAALRASFDGTLLWTVTIEEAW
jgi:hypothetical protein